MTCQASYLSKLLLRTKKRLVESTVIGESLVVVETLDEARQGGVYGW